MCLTLASAKWWNEWEREREWGEGERQRGEGRQRGRDGFIYAEGVGLLDFHWESRNTAYMMVACIQRAVREWVCDTNSVHGHWQHANTIFLGHHRYPRTVLPAAGMSARAATVEERLVAPHGCIFFDYVCRVLDASIELLQYTCIRSLLTRIRSLLTLVRTLIELLQ